MTGFIAYLLGSVFLPFLFGSVKHLRKYQVHLSSVSSVSLQLSIDKITYGYVDPFMWLAILPLWVFSFIIGYVSVTLVDFFSEK